MLGALAPPEGLQNEVDIGHHADQQRNGGDGIAFVADVIGHSAADGGGR